MSDSQLAGLTTANVDFVGFWPRTAAAFVDVVLLKLVEAPFMIWAYGVSYYTYWSGSPRVVNWPIEILSGWIVPAAVTISLWRKWQTTPGKFLFKAYVVDADTLSPATTKRYFIRYVGYFVAGLPLLIGILAVAFDPRKQGWHDKLAKTVVIRRPRRRPSLAA